MTSSIPQQTNARHFAWEILMAIEGGSSLLEISLQDELERSSLNDLDRKLAEKIIKGVLENKTFLDQQISPFVRKNFSKTEPDVKTILRIGAYQILFFDRIPAQIAVNESVNLAKKVATDFQASFINAVLRKVVLAKSEAPKSSQQAGTTAALAEQFSHPLWIVERWVEQVGYEETRQLCILNNSPAPLSARLNRLAGSDAVLWEAINSDGLATKPGQFLENCFSITALPTGLRLGELPSFRQGLFLIQDESSALVVKVLAAEPGETVVDLCAAPGGKTTYLAELVHSTGRVIAVDVSERRLGSVKENCQRMNISNVEFLTADGTTLTLPSKVDRILIDAPCSGLGALGRKKDIRWNKQDSGFKQLESMQMALLKNAADVVRVGGTLVYSTCSTEDAENEGVIHRFLQQNKNIKVRPITSLPASPGAAALVTAEGFLRTWPQRHGGIGGAFAAVLERIA